MKKKLLLFFFIIITGKYTAEADNRPSFSGKTPHQHSLPVSYFIHPVSGDDANSGTSKEKPFKTLRRIEKIKLGPGDKIILAGGQVYEGSLRLINQQGAESNPIQIISANWNDNKPLVPAIINFKSLTNGILIQDCSFIHVFNIRLTANGFDYADEKSDMRCGVMVNNAALPEMKDILLDHLFIKDVFYENPGFVRDKSEVLSANGTQSYGWGIRVLNKNADNLISQVQIQNCTVTDVCHTGIKLTGNKKNIKDVQILNNSVNYTGGPGIQMSEVKDVYVGNNVVDHSGSNNDSRKWGRGSGLWTWGSSDVLIEKNKFLHANGPGDSDGAHIDFNCENIIIQYNLSAYNAGGFCEILGNNYNCIYRYNISVNDGYRIKGKDGAFQEGKTLWLSGYQGNNQKRKGPVNTYIYNNTIYVDASIMPKIAFDNTSRNVLIANNIFYLINPFELVLGDQSKPDANTGKAIENMQLKNNLFLNVNSWPDEVKVTGNLSFFGNPVFKTPGSLQLPDYLPMNTEIISKKGLRLSDWKIGDAGSVHSLQMEKDILGNPVPELPAIGAIEPGVHHK